jgi:predicted small secreted protein
MRLNKNKNIKEEKMRSFQLFVVLVMLCAVVVTGCGGGQAVQASPAGPLTQAPQPNTRPDWWMSPDADGSIFLYGMASDQVNERAAIETATNAARAAAAEFIEAHVKTLTEDFLRQSGTENPQVLQQLEMATRNVANATYSGGRRTKEATYPLANGRFQSYIQYRIPEAQVNRNLINAIKNEEALYNEFKATQAFEKLDKLTE